MTVSHQIIPQLNIKTLSDFNSFDIIHLFENITKISIRVERIGFNEKNLNGLRLLL